MGPKRPHFPIIARLGAGRAPPCDDVIGPGTNPLEPLFGNPPSLVAFDTPSTTAPSLRFGSLRARWSPPTSPPLPDVAGFSLLFRTRARCHWWGIDFQSR
jgi:hypothetical protein